MSIQVIKVCKVGIDFENPVSLGHDDGADVHSACQGAQERLVLDPRNNVVQGPGSDEHGGGGRQVPTKYRWIEEDEKSVGNSQSKLFTSKQGRLTQACVLERGAPRAKPIYAAAPRRACWRW